MTVTTDNLETQNRRYQRAASIYRRFGKLSFEIPGLPWRNIDMNKQLSTALPLSAITYR